MKESVIEHDLKRRILGRVAFLYGDAAAAGILARIEALIARYAGRIAPRRAGWSQADALLITYADSLLGSRNDYDGVRRTGRGDGRDPPRPSQRQRAG
ncbi:MAG: hypothetical protein ACOC7R_01775 [Planctomycetota bacterium]